MCLLVPKLTKLVLSISETGPKSVSWSTYQSTYYKIISHLCFRLFFKEGMRPLSEEWEGGGMVGRGRTRGSSKGKYRGGIMSITRHGRLGQVMTRGFFHIKGDIIS